MPPPPLPQPALALPDLVPGTCANGLLPEVEMDEGGGSQQAAALPVQRTAKEEEMAVSLPRHAEGHLADDVLKNKSGHDKGNNATGSPKKSSKIHVHTVRNGKLRVVDGGSVSQPDIQIIVDAFKEGDEDKEERNAKEKGSDAWVPQILSQDVILNIDEMPTTDDASDTPVEDNASPSPAKALGTDIASVVSIVHQPFRQPTLSVSLSLAFTVKKRLLPQEVVQLGRVQERINTV